MMSWLRSSLVLAAVALLTAGLAAATDDPQLPGVVLPGDWAGVWTVTEQHVDCDDFAPMGEPMVFERIFCTGEYFEFIDPSAGFTCTEFADGDGITFHCWGTQELWPDCDLTTELEYQMTRTGDTAEFWQTMVQTTSGGGCFDTSTFCERVEGTAVRIAPEPESCGTPVAAETWSTIKATYR